MKRWILVVFCFLMVFPESVPADESVLGTAGKILQIGVGPRAVGMGEAQVAAANDLYALYWNPAGLAAIRSPQLSYMHNLWLQDIQDAYVTYAQRLFRGGFALSVNYFNFGEFEKIGVDPSGYPLPTSETFTPYTLVVSAGYGTRVTPEMNFGGTVKLVNESVDTFSSMTLAMDLGMQYRLLKGLKTGLAIQNLGLPLEGYQLPMNVKAGISYRIPFVINEKRDRFLSVVDVNLPIPFDQPFYTNIGLEYFYLGIISLRGGYKISEINGLGDAAGLTAGIGVNVTGFILDYAVAPFGDLGMTHRMALTYTFISPKRAKKKTQSIKRRKVKRKTKKKSGGSGLMLPPDTRGGTGGQVLMPKVSKMKMRKAIRMEVESEISSQNETQIEQAVFQVRFSEKKSVRRWILSIVGPDGRVVKKYSGKGLPTKLVWDGTGKERNKVAEGIFCRYAMKMELSDGSVEKLRGKIYTRDLEVSDSQSNREVLPRIYFGEGAADLSDRSLRTLKSIAKKIKSQPYIKVSIEGYTDNHAEKSMSFLLSQRRAITVSRYLTATYKIPLKKVSTHARGSKSPIASNQTEKGRTRNRRVEIVIIYRQ
ncbi:PorV/PorQ family protein [bacterium]|nr:PorV/PorQ family protein [bacterium]